MVYGHDDYGPGVKISEAFKNPQGYYLFVTKDQDVAAPVLGIVPSDELGRFNLMLKVNDDILFAEGIDGDVAVFDIGQERYIWYLGQA
jgi:hypothetical protein